MRGACHFPARARKASGSRPRNIDMHGSSRKVMTRRLATLGVLAGALAAVPPAMAGGGNVLPATARQRGYSLADLARATAAFNLSDRDPADLPPLPFQVLYTPPDG